MGVGIERTQWRERTAAHLERADALTAVWRASRAAGRAHPIDDFLFTYYGSSASLLRRWHPGEGVALLDAADAPHRAWRWYGAGDAPGSVVADAAAFRVERAPLVAAIARILRGTMSRPGQWGCFGMHEWAMVYRADETRHPVPLRLGRDGTDAVVEASALRCTHFDAFRFFTPAAAPRNAAVLTRDGQASTEQPGCLHAGMDLVKWAMKLGPLVPGELLLDAFALARDIRWLDMAASPYDVSAWGAVAVEVETAAGRAEYARRQREFAERAAPIRAALAQIADPSRR